MEKRILDFMDEHHILTLAVSRENIPYCATCFYVYLPEKNIFVFTSDRDTRHIEDALLGNNFHVAGTIALETRMVGKIRGIQFTGTLLELTGETLKSAKSAYLKRFPVALLATLHLWAVEPDLIKMTDNRLGFGKKLIWTSKQNDNQ